MSGPRRDRILAGTALALILAAPFAVPAQEGSNAGAKSAAVATGASPAGPGKTQDSAAYPGDEPTGTLNAADVEHRRGARHDARWKGCV